MISEARHRQIVSTIGQQGSAKVSDLARLFGVTEETIRRDLRALSDRGALIRTHGGALALTEPANGQIDLPFDKRRLENQSQKRAIAQKALSLIRPGDVIALDASSTVCELARLLPETPMTVLTNSLAVCSILAGKQPIQTVCTGGVLDSEAMAFVGLQAEQALEFFNITRFFFSCRGIDLKRGISEPTDRHASWKLKALSLTGHSVLLADASKFGLASSVFYTPASSIDTLVTEAPRGDAQAKRLRQFQEQGVTVEQVDEHA